MSSSGQSLFITEVTIHYRKDYGVLVTFRKIVNNKTIVTLTLEAVTKLCSEISKKRNLRSIRIKTPVGTLFVEHSEGIYKITPKKIHGGKKFLPKNPDNQTCELRLSYHQVMYLKECVEGYKPEKNKIHRRFLNPLQKF